ncbi:MAG: hypothetical protein KKA07_11505 [Bacteroidetes bacterium]|nr:hypothetical protein [Bacteroidota bacterium]MBU1719685.1 hypothetical protein [Bacteroidota bacterium]
MIFLTASGMTDQKDAFGLVADDFLIKPIYKNDLLKVLIKYLPYTELQPVENQHARTGLPVNADLVLPSGLKEELMTRFIPAILKLQETLNIDEIAGLVKELSKFNEEHQVEAISEYCIKLSGDIGTFNINQILVTLNSMTEFIKK